MNNTPETEDRFPTFRRAFAVVFGRRPVKRTLFAAACFATVIALFFAVENWRGAQAQEALRSEWLAKGSSLDPASFIPPPIPDAENFATTPFFAPLFDFIPGTQVPRDTNAMARVHGFAKDFPSVSTRGGWRVGGRTDLAEVYSGICRARGEPTEREVDIRQAAAVIVDYVKEFDPVLNELREAATRPRSRFNVRYETENPWAILLPHLAAIKRLSQVLWVRASAEVVLGQTDRAFEDVGLMLVLADSIKDEPILISQLVRMAGFNMAMQVIWEGMAGRQWSEAQLVAFQNRMARYHFLADCKRALEGERAWANVTIRRVRDGHVSFEEFGYGSEDGKGSAHDLEVAFALRAGPRGWFDLEQVNYNRVMDERFFPNFDVEARRIHARLADDNTRRLEELLSGGDLRAALRDHLIFAKMLLPAVSKALQKFGLAQTSADQAFIVCALERHRLANGDYPANLEALAPAPAARIPTDLFSGEPFRYRRIDGQRFVLYSIGWNEKDDGGAVVRIKNSPKGVQDLTEGDWVWRHSAAE